MGRWLRPVEVMEILAEGIIAEGEFFAPRQAITSRVQEFGSPFIVPEAETFPSVGWRIIPDAIVKSTRHFPYLVHGNQMMIGSRRNPGPWRVVKRGNEVVWQRGHRALVNVSRGHTKDVGQALLLGGHAHSNWYHWLVDALPQLHTARLLPDAYRHWPVLIPEEVFGYPTMVDAVELFLDGRDIIRIPSGSRIRGTICWIDSLEIINLPESEVTPRPLSQIHLLHREGMESYRQVFIERFGSNPSPDGEKIFLTREGTRRQYNQDEVAAVAAEFGFRAVAPETLSLAEQVALFHHATHLIGPSGAGFAGLLFSQPNTQVLCWQDSRLTAMTILPDLAALADSHYWHLLYKPESGGIFTGDYHLDVEKIRRTLQEFTTPDR